MVAPGVAWGTGEGEGALIDPLISSLLLEPACLADAPRERLDQRARGEPDSPARAPRLSQADGLTGLAEALSDTLIA